MVEQDVQNEKVVTECLTQKYLGKLGTHPGTVTVDKQMIQAVAYDFY